MAGSAHDLAALLAVRRRCPLDFWLDPLSPATAVLMPYLDLDGHSHGGLPWRFRGRHCVGLRLLPDPTDELSMLVARCVLATRAWAVEREGDDHIVSMDYDVPWGYVAALQRDLGAVHAFGLSHLVATAGRQGDWLGDWVAEHQQASAVGAALADDQQLAQRLGIVDTPCIVVRGARFAASSMPDDVGARVEALLAS